MPSSRGYLLLAFVEDVKEYPNPRETPAYHRLRGALGLSDNLLESLIVFAEPYRAEFPLFPEEIVLQWELELTGKSASAERIRG